MATKEYKDIERFIVQSENGVKYQIIVFQEFLVNLAVDGSVTRTPGMMQSRTLNGYHLDHVGDNQYLIEELNLPVSRV